MAGGHAKAPPDTVLGLILLTGGTLPPAPRCRLRLLAVPLTPGPAEVLTVVIRDSTRGGPGPLAAGLRIRVWGRLYGRTLEARRLERCGTVPRSRPRSLFTPYPEERKDQ